MQTIKFCEMPNCQSKAVHKHHLYSNTKRNRQVYGKLIDDPRNLMDICQICHMWKPLKKMNEKEFCARMGIAPRGKVEQAKNLFD